MQIDPITLEVIRCGLMSIGREMGVTLVRTGYSILFKENEDATAAILDKNGNIIAQDVHCTAHMGSMQVLGKWVINEVGRENIAPGDVIMTNDPYHGAGHLPDIMLISPVVYDNDLVFYVGDTGHHVDMGGKDPGSVAADATEIYGEGLLIPPVKLFERGVLNKDLLALFASNVRIPDDRVKDLQAQVAALKSGQKRLQALMDKYGKETVINAVEEIQNYSERLTRAEIRKMPKGKVEFEDFLDDDGYEHKTVKIKCALEVKDEDLVFDFTGTDRQVRGSANMAIGWTMACVYYVVKCVTGANIPVNAGCYRPLEVIAPEGSLVNPRPPATLATGTETICRVVDVLLGCFAQIIPEKVIAACGGTHSIYVTMGTNRKGLPFMYYENFGAGWGAGVSHDGASGRDTDVANARNIPVETNETEYPFFIRKHALLPDSGGAGKWRGGLGFYREWEMLTDDVSLCVVAERYKFRPYGLFGGKPGERGSTIIRKADGTEIKTYGKVPRMYLKKGDIVIVSTPGGGGYGNPFERDPELVLKDIIKGYVSIEAAKKDYGLLINPETLTIDFKGTAKLRERMRKEIKLAAFVDRGPEFKQI